MDSHCYLIDKHGTNHNKNGMMAFRDLGYPSIFFLFQLLRGIANAVRILKVEKTNKLDSIVWQAMKYPAHSTISPK